jgi:hypothetical protein
MMNKGQTNQPFLPSQQFHLVSLLFPFLCTLNQILSQPQAATQFAPFFELLLRQPRPYDFGVGG